MIAFALQGANLPFTIALGIMSAITLMEVLGALFGASISSAVDSLMPDADLDVDLDLDADIDAPDIGGFHGLLDWLCIGRIPILILVMMTLFFFGVSGLLVQAVVQGLSGWLLPGILAAAPAVALTLPAVHFAGRGFEKLFPKDETYVVSDSSFIGEVATVTLGTAEAGKPAQAKLTDRHGRAHYVQVEPDEAGIRFETGSQVLLVRRDGAVFKVIAATGALVSEEW